MTRHESYVVDNRDASQMYEYLEARIETMKRRIVELERENQSLRHEIRSVDCRVLESA
jgi:predicted RNase H-like nuclease (RuvC/YqgF family)